MVRKYEILFRNRNWWWKGCAEVHEIVPGKRFIRHGKLYVKLY